jgi:hypothetical protein
MTAPRTDPPTTRSGRLLSRRLQRMGVVGRGWNVDEAICDVENEALAALPSAPDQRLREALDKADALSRAVLEYRSGHTIEGLAAEYHRVRAALSESATSPEAITDRCPMCGGDGWTIDADPLPSGEPGAPYQVQCSGCGGSGQIVVGEATTSSEATLDVALLAEAIAAVDLRLPPGNDRERSHWRTSEPQREHARDIAAEYARLRGPA